MKHARRLLAGLLTAVMLLALLPTAFAAEDDPLTRGQARDILLAAADDYNPGVKAEDVLQGDKDGNLYLDRPVTRVELLVMLSNAFGQLPEPPSLPTCPTGPGRPWRTCSRPALFPVPVRRLSPPRALSQRRSWTCSSAGCTP